MRKGVHGKPVCLFRLLCVHSNCIQSYYKENLEISATWTCWPVCEWKRNKRNVCGTVWWAAGSRLMDSRVIAWDCNVITAVCCTMNNSHADQIRKRRLGKLFKKQWFHRSTGTVIPPQAPCIMCTPHSLFSLFLPYIFCGKNGPRFIFSLLPNYYIIKEKSRPTSC